MKNKILNLMYASAPPSLLKYVHFKAHKDGIRHWANSKMVFLHVPKSAGTSINKFFKCPDIGHFTYNELVKLDARYGASDKIFVSIIRDPVERLNSTYQYAISQYRRKGVSTLAWIADYKSSDSFIQHVYEKKLYRKHYFFRPAADFSGTDRLFKFLDFSNLNEALISFNNAYGTRITLERHNVSKSSEVEFSDESIALIEEMYKDDIAIIRCFKSSGEALLEGDKIYKG